MTFIELPNNMFSFQFEYLWIFTYSKYFTLQGLYILGYYYLLLLIYPPVMLFSKSRCVTQWKLPMDETSSNVLVLTVYTPKMFNTINDKDKESQPIFSFYRLEPLNVSSLFLNQLKTGA